MKSQIFQTRYTETETGECRWVSSVYVIGVLSNKPFAVPVAEGELWDASEAARRATLATAKEYAHVALTGGRTFA